MSREIKFDFIYKGDFQFHHKKYYLDELIDNTLASLSDIHSQMELIAKRQYTGLKDKSGKEIYEGDILNNINNKLWIIEWANKDDYCGFAAADFTGLRTLFLNQNFDNCEIIGNIYENPELLP